MSERRGSIVTEERAELPVQTVASLSNMNDPANNMNVSSLIWEIRRWHQLDKLDTAKYPNYWCP